MAITRREQQMLDLRDSGMSSHVIARRMGIKQASVKRTLGLLSGSIAADRRREAAIRQGSRDLLARIREEHG